MPKDSPESQGSATAVRFNSFRSGMFYTRTDYLTLEGNETVTIPFPCQITVNGRCKVVVTEVDGLIDTVKEDMGFSGYNLSISFEAGDYALPPPESGFVKAHQVIDDLARLVQTHKGEVGLIERATVYRNEQGQMDPQQSLLFALEIQYVVLQSIDIKPLRNHRYQVTLSAVAEMDRAVELFPTKKDYETKEVSSGA